MILVHTRANRLLAIFFIFCFVLIATGCSSTVEIPETVYVPTKCSITAPERPASVATGDTDYAGMIQDVQNILIYTETLENKLNFCIEGAINE